MLNVDTSISQWSVAEDDFLSLNSDVLPPSEHLWAASLTIRGFPNPAGSSSSGAGAFMFLIG